MGELFEESSSLTAVQNFSKRETRYNDTENFDIDGAS